MKNTSLLILIILSLNSFSKTIISTKSGNWNSINTWNTFTIPTNADTVIITNQDTININTNLARCDYLELDGTLFFKSNSNNLTSRIIYSKNKSEINGTSLALLTVDEFINNGMLSIGKIKLSVSKEFINNSTLEFSSISGTKTFGQLINFGIINNKKNESLFIEKELNNHGEINWNSAPITFIKNGVITSKNLLNIETIIFNDSLTISDSIRVKYINGSNLINRGYLDFSGKESSILIKKLIPIKPNTIVFSYHGSVSVSNFTNNNFDNLILSCDRFLVDRTLNGFGEISVLKNTTLVIESENIFPLFKSYHFAVSSNVIFKKHTLLPKPIVFGNIEIESSFILDLKNVDSLFITGNVNGSGTIKNHRNIVYNGTKKQKIKRMDYNTLIYNNSGTDTSSLLGTNKIDSLMVVNGRISIGGLTINNSIVSENGTIIIGGSNPTFKNDLSIDGLVTLNQNQSSPIFNNIITLPNGIFKNNASSNPTITGNISNNGKFIGCNGTSCDYNFTNNRAYISGIDTVFISKIKAKHLTNSGLLVVSQSLKVDTMIANLNAQLWLQMDSAHISGYFNFYSYYNTVTFNKKSVQNISKKMNRFHHLIIKKEGKKVIHKNTFIKHQLDIYEKSTLKTDSFQTDFASNAKLNVRKSGNLILGHNYANNQIFFPLSLQRNNINLHDSSFIHYAGKKDQTISCLPIYGNLTIDDGAVDSSFIDLDNDTLYVNGNLNLQESSINLKIIDKVIKVKGDWNGPGNCILTSGKFYLGGNGNSSGKITPGKSIFIYNGKSKQRFKISKYNNVIIDKNGEVFTKANIGTLYIDSLFVKNGIMNFKGEESFINVLTVEDSVIFGSSLQEKIFNNINIYSNGLFELDYNETVTIKGDIDCNGIFNVKKGELLFTDSFPQSITGNGVIALSKTTINKQKSHLSIYTDCTLKDTLQMDSGNILLNDACLTLEDKSCIKNENKNAYFSGNEKGTIKTSRLINKNQSNDFNGIGITIENILPMGNTLITRKFNSINIVGGQSAFKNFDISPTFNSNINANLEMNFFTADLNKLNTNNLALWKTEDNINWIKMGGITNQNKIYLTNISSFSKWTINVNTLNLLSVDLISYSVKRKDEIIKIDWEVASESNTTGYLIELSNDGVNFKKQTIVKTNYLKVYNYNLQNTSNNPTFIRVSEITQGTTKALFKRYVRPFSGIRPKIRVTNSKIFIDNFNDGIVKIFSSTGQLVEEKMAQNEFKTTFPKGIYFILLENKTETKTFKIGVK